MSYQRLSSEERFLIARNFAGSKRVRAIARLLGRAASTVRRELGRNGNGSIVGRPRHELRSMANRYDEDSDSAHQKAVRSSQFGDGPGSGRNRLARRLWIWLSNSCQEAIARSKSQPFQVSIQGQLVMLGFILGLGQDRRHGGQLFKHLRYSRQEEEKQALERTCAVLSLIGSASPSAPKGTICAAVLAIGKVTLLSVG